jgi:hypothetical protein
MPGLNCFYLRAKCCFLACLFLALFTLRAYPQKDDNPFKQIRNSTQHFGLLAGWWFPRGNLEVLGNHPYLGMQGGMRRFQHEFDLELDIRFGKSQSEYKVYRDGQFYYSRDFLGGYLGMDYKYYFLINPREEAGVLAGIGYDGFSLNRDSIPSGPYEIGSLNLNGGFRFNIYSRSGTYLGFQARYNFISYKNKGGTSFSGNAISVTIYVGGIWRSFQQNQ